MRQNHFFCLMRVTTKWKFTKPPGMWKQSHYSAQPSRRMGWQQTERPAARWDSRWPTRGADGDYLKFRCPHATGKVDCPLGMAACSSSNYGMVVKVDAKDDLRRFCSPHRDTKHWKKLYNKRTSVERCNSRMKTYLAADDMYVWGIQKVMTHQYLNAIVLFVSALFSAASKKNQTAA